MEVFTIASDDEIDMEVASETDNASDAEAVDANFDFEDDQVSFTSLRFFNISMNYIINI